MRRSNNKTVRFMILIAGLAVAMLVESSQAQQKIDAQLERATTEYKSNLEHLVTLYEAESKGAEERLTKVRELLAEGLITRRDVQAAEDTVEQTRKKVAEAQAQLKSADVLIAEALVEAAVDNSVRTPRPSSAPRAVSTLVRTTAYIRYGGAGAWTISDAPVIKQFFIRRFGRALPIDAFGQSALHDRWGYDHRNAMDVGVNPDSNEGQALMEYLRANGIPFTAFHFAVPGKATGPHIHVGLPSHRIAPRWIAANSGNISSR
jgi:Outer membrane efflux protein